ncbi:MAG: 2-phospho-L-lactate transferase CofD family protein, partial [Tepidiformaceae bacterium]
DVSLSARTSDNELVHGEHNISERGGAIRDLFLNPPDAEAHPDAVRAILDADLVVIGPGSLYTSIMPNLLVGGIQKALFATSACRIFVCNVATQHGETDGFTVSDHLTALEHHSGKGLIHGVVANNNIASTLPEAWHSAPVPVSKTRMDAFEGVLLVEEDVVAEENRYRHDPVKLAATILRMYDDRDSFTFSVAPAVAEEPVLITR